MITRTRDNTRKIRQFPDHVAYIFTSPHDTEPATFHRAQNLPQMARGHVSRNSGASQQ